MKPIYLDLKWVEIYPLAKLQHMKYMSQTHVSNLLEIYLSIST